VFPVDPALIQQVAVNLILNAAEAIGGTGVVGLETRIVDGGALEIAVQDSGPGVPAELAEEIFRPFFTTRRGGTGLGLAISRKLVESHGGRLRVEPAPGGGARFILVLPPPAPATAAGASTPAP
jgi:signal transduction histidine kinase